MTKTVKEPNYTTEQEDRIREVADENGELNMALADELAAEFGKSRRSVIAKAIRMDVPYASKVPTSKDGTPVASKAKIVEQIGAVVGGNVDGLEKASKAALQNLRRFVEATRAA